MVKGASTRLVAQSIISVQTVQHFLIDVFTPQNNCRPKACVALTQKHIAIRLKQDTSMVFRKTGQQSLALICKWRVAPLMNFWPACIPIGLIRMLVQQSFAQVLFKAWNIG